MISRLSSTAPKDIAHCAVVLAISLILAVSYGCAVKLVPSYDQQTYSDILKVAKDTDQFYINLLSKPETERKYASCADDYKSIEVELRMLKLVNDSRPLNDQSAEIIDSILKKWLVIKDAHMCGQAQAKIVDTATCNDPELAKKLAPYKVEDSHGNWVLIDSYSSSQAKWDRMTLFDRFSSALRAEKYKGEASQPGQQDGGKSGKQDGGKSQGK